MNFLRPPFPPPQGIPPLRETPPPPPLDVVARPRAGARGSGGGARMGGGRDAGGDGGARQHPRLPPEALHLQGHRDRRERQQVLGLRQRHQLLGEVRQQRGKVLWESDLTLYGPNSFFRRFSGHNLR